MHNYDTYNNNHQSDAGALVIRKALVSRAASTRSLEVPQRYAYLSGPAEPTYVADYVVDDAHCLQPMPRHIRPSHALQQYSQ